MKFRNIYLPLLLDFIESATEENDADKLVRKITKRTADITLFLELLDEITEILSGVDRQKINWVLRHPLFFHYYRRNLFSSSMHGKLLACVYFTKSGSINNQISFRLLQLSTSKKIKLAYAAAKALQSSDNIYSRRNTLIDFMKRTDASNLMVGELLHLFWQNCTEMYDESGTLLNQVLLQKDVLPEKKQIVIQYIAHQNLYSYSIFLLRYLEAILYGPKNKELIKSLITALGMLKVTEAIPVIQQYAKVPDVELRLVSIEALNHLGGDDNLEFIIRMIFDIEFDVRKKIITVLVQNPGVGHDLLEVFILTHLKFISKIWKTDFLPKELLVFVDKFSSITSGIRIISANQGSRYTANSI